MKWIKKFESFSDGDDYYDDDNLYDGDDDGRKLLPIDSWGWDFMVQMSENLKKHYPNFYTELSIPPKVKANMQKERKQKNPNFSSQWRQEIPFTRSNASIQMSFKRSCSPIFTFEPEPDEEDIRINLISDDKSEAWISLVYSTSLCFEPDGITLVNGVPLIEQSVFTDILHNLDNTMISFVGTRFFEYFDLVDTPWYSSSIPEIKESLRAELLSDICQFIFRAPNIFAAAIQRIFNGYKSGNLEFSFFGRSLNRSQSNTGVQFDLYPEKVFDQQSISKKYLDKIVSPYLLTRLLNQFINLEPGQVSLLESIKKLIPEYYNELVSKASGIEIESSVLSNLRSKCPAIYQDIKNLIPKKDQWATDLQADAGEYGL